MSKIEKLIHRFLTIPTDFTFPELIKILNYFGYEEIKSGKTSGSRAAFANIVTKDIIKIHTPHPTHILKEYQIKHIINTLIEKGILKDG
ncbi:MAG: type II toxin-antitoxin system HicA family toxin [Candidatus Magnetoovum sp. WYHC-5]|nr:type II toxin-antitoxin system HicA family toxin [Candidatus Magnetoovum sp. WYHC-5]